MIKALQRKQSVLRQPMKAMDAGARGRRLLQRREHQRYVSDIIPDHLKDEYTPIIEALRRGAVSVMPDHPRTKELEKKDQDENENLKRLIRIRKKIQRAKMKEGYTPVIEEGKSAKKCKDGQYYCFNDKKCKPIPSGYRIGYGGMLRPENKEDESNGKKGGSNGNGNGNGGNGNGHGGNGNGGNGGGNGGGE